MGNPLEPACRLVRADDTYDGKQGLTYFCGIAAETVGSKGICMHLLTIPPGGRAKAHMHENHETAIYVLEGEAIALLAIASSIRQSRKLEICSTYRPACRISRSISATSPYRP
jgi:oxalate decarboxylase/phosphoglucose isomerase-like protein (cupin superfamily)